jgi:hypothetical protein
MITKRWKPFVVTRCICKSKTTEHPSTDESTVNFLQQAYRQSPRKSRNRANRDLALPQNTVWHAVWKWLHTVRTGQSKTLCSVFSICAKMYDQLFFVGLTTTGIPYREILTKWLLLQFLNESISPLDWPSYWHIWLHWSGFKDHLTSLEFFLYCVCVCVCVCYHHREVRNIWNSIATKVAQIDRPMLKKRMIRCGILGCHMWCHPWSIHLGVVS